MRLLEIMRQAHLDEPGARDVARDALLQLGYSDERATRSVRSFPERVVENRLRYALEGAGLRRTKHGHEDIVQYVLPGHEDAKSTIVNVASSNFDLPRSYTRKAYSIACSTHRWFVSAAILDVPDDWHADGHVYLTRRLRVRNGRGASLVRETNVHGKWEAIP